MDIILVDGVCHDSYKVPFSREFRGAEACNQHKGIAIGCAPNGVPFAVNLPEEWGLNSADLPSFELRVADLS